MQLSEITPMILTHNEESNLRATLQGLAWARQILLVDSFSDDATLKIAAEFPQVRVIQRSFDHFAPQCNFGLERIETEWVLSLDADYKCDESLAHELRRLEATHAGYRARFRYGIFGRPLRAALYPPRTVLYRRDSASYERDGHAHRVIIDGSVGELQTPILHDDWKPLTIWCRSQAFYAALEADKLLSCSNQDLGWKDRIRKKIVLAPLLTPIYCLFAKGLILDGWPGIFYSLQRCFAESCLSLVLLDRKLRARSPEPELEPEPGPGQEPEPGPEGGPGPEAGPVADQLKSTR